MNNAEARDRIRVALARYPNRRDQILDAIRTLIQQVGFGYSGTAPYLRIWYEEDRGVFVVQLHDTYAGLESILRYLLDHKLILPVTSALEFSYLITNQRPVVLDPAPRYPTEFD